MIYKRNVIFGAQSFACGAYRAIKDLYPESRVECFLVTKTEGNPGSLCGLPVETVEAFASKLSGSEKMECRVIVATPEDLFPEIVVVLNAFGFSNIECLDSRKDSALMEKYYEKCGLFKSLRKLPKGDMAIEPQVYQVKFYKDKAIKHDYAIPKWCVPLQVGAALTDIRVASETDNTGENISCKNPNYCELTALYWMWKNKILCMSDDSYMGMFHYRRLLDVSEEDLYRFRANDVDVVLPYPTIHENGICMHHTRYVKEADWQVMLQALAERQPKYAEAYEQIFLQPYFYNYSIMIAKKSVLEDYFRWLFSILERTEELSVPKEWERSDRYLAYMGESLTTLYFMYHAKDLNIVHAGRIMLT